MAGPPAGLVGISEVNGGIVTGPGAPTVIINGSTCATIGDDVSAHGLPPHDAATIVTGSSTVLAMGKAVARVSDLASCDDPIETGSANVLVGG